MMKTRWRITLIAGARTGRTSVIRVAVIYAWMRGIDCHRSWVINFSCLSAIATKLHDEEYSDHNDDEHTDNFHNMFLWIHD